MVKNGKNNNNKVKEAYDRFNRTKPALIFRALAFALSYRDYINWAESKEKHFDDTSFDEFYKRDQVNHYLEEAKTLFSDQANLLSKRYIKEDRDI